MRVALCQLNLRVGDLVGNADRIIDAVAGLAVDVDVAVFPELSIAGYPPEDLVLKAGFVADNLDQLDRIAAATGETAVVVGVVDRGPGGVLYNGAAVCAQGRVAGIYHKRELPNYAVFDEERYFEPGPAAPALFELAGVPVGVSVCEDAWTATGPIPALVAGGARVVLNINGSPFRRGKQDVREQEVVGALVTETRCPIVYVNLVGGQDELVFDGGSFVMDADGDLVSRSPHFVEDVVVVDVEPAAATTPSLEVVPVTGPRPDKPPLAEAPVALPLDPNEEIWRALCLGTRDYVTKNGFTEVVIALSGGVDSTIVAAIATDALGADRVHGVLMPSRFSSEHSVDDARRLSENLGIDHRVIAIEPAHAALLEMLAPSFEGTGTGLTEENIQSRIRGVTVMALSNKFGWMVLTTGNKSETSVGYATLYGDTAGGYAVIKDVPKLLVYELCHHRNAKHASEHPGEVLIPEHILTKPPSAELRPDQRDDQSLPPYEVLDPILEEYVENDRTASELVEMGHDAELVRRIIGLVDRAEYKRRQSPPGPRVTHKAFGKDRRLPITNGYRG